MKKAALIVLLLLLLGSAGGVGYWYVYIRPGNGPEVIRVSGNIEVTEVEMSFKIPGRVLRRDVDEGESINAGEPVALLEDADLRQDLALRAAELNAARAQLQELDEGSRPQEIEAARAAMKKAEAAWKDLEAGPRAQEIASATASWKAAISERDRTQADYRRAINLYTGNLNAITKEQYDSVKSAYEVAQERTREAEEKLNLLKAGYRPDQIESAKAAFEQARAEFDLVKEGPRNTTIAQAKARVQQAEAAAKLAETRIDYTKIVSPLTGVVLSKNIEEGEYVSAGTPVVTIGDTVNVWLRAYIPENLNGRIHKGQKVRVTTDSHPGVFFPGRIAFISQDAEFTPKSVQTDKERVKLVYRIKIDITNKKDMLNPGMPADAIIDLDPLTEK